MTFVYSLSFGLLFALGIGLEVFTSPAIAEQALRVVDGDTLHLNQQKIRLHGIDAPEGRQTCERDGVAWLCGQEVSKALREQLEGTQVVCDPIEKDRYGRTVAKCSFGTPPVDIGEWLVRNGSALAYRQYSMDYVEAEDEAREARRGLWSGEFEMPWEWRRSKR